MGTILWRPARHRRFVEDETRAVPAKATCQSSTLSVEERRPARDRTLCVVLLHPSRACSRLESFVALTQL
eukprot:6582519-Prymnesium_polylepis.1